MEEQGSSESSGDARLKEIQASIAEGNMMLQVLRSLPPSENNNSFIIRFEELISRLEAYKPRINRAEEDEIHSQLDALKEKQEKIRCLLAQTATDFQNSATGLPGSSQQGSVLQDSPAEVKNMVSVKKVLNSDRIESKLLPNIPRQSAENTPSNRAEDGNVTPRSVPESTVSNVSTAADASLSSLKWSSQFAVQVTKLNDLIEDTKRFEGMVERLLDITKRARLEEPSSFLGDILVRFSELRQSFNSLRDSYQDMSSDPQMSDELREIQLSSFKEFLNKLDQSLESTKECFFTIYHLVKSNIEQGIADGSLYGVESGEDEEDGPAQSNTQTTVLSTSDTVNPLVQQPETTSSTPLVNSVTSKVNSTLEAQKAYLALLQGQTKTERAEIERLLRQRNELAERLRTLRAAASDVVEPHDVREHSLDTSASTQKDTNGHQHGSCELEPALFGHLEAKRRELADLKAQLALLRQAEDRMAALHGPSTKQNGANTCQLDVDSDTQERQARSQRPSPAANTLILKTCLSKSGMQEHNQLAKNDHSTSAVTQKLDTVTFQQPEATCISDNTERLYENMREARMRLEEQRVRSTHLTSAAPERLTNGLSEGVKNTAFVTCSGGGGASVATSQDRTTLATWGGSSPVPSSSRSPSSGLPEELEEATSAPDSLPAFLPTQPSTNHVEDMTTDSALHRISPVKNTLSQKSTRSTERHTCLSGGLTQQPSADRHLLHPEDNNDGLISLPQLGQSPPPPIGHSRSAELHSDGNEPSNGFIYISENGTEPPTMQSYKAATGNQLTAVGEERLQRLEIAVSQLHQISRYLVLENTQLYTAVMQLMLHAAPAQLPQTLPVPLASSANVLSQTSQPDTCGSLAQPLLSTQCTLLQNYLTNGQLQPPSALPLGSLHRSWNPGLPSQIRQATQDHDQLQIAMANLMQQQISCLNAQNELQRLLRQQLQHRQQLVVNTGLQSVTSNQVSSQLLSPVSNPPSAPTSIPAASCAVGAADLLRSGVGSTLWVNPQSYGGLPPGITGTPSWPYLQPSQPPSSASGGPRPVSVAALGQPQLGVPPLIDLYGQLFAPPHASSFGLNQQTGVSGNPPSAIPDPINPMWIPPHSIAGRGFL